jgi:hypothetical protein
VKPLNPDLNPRPDLFYYSSHLEKKLALLAVADQELHHVECEVFDRVTHMARPSPGRIPWPEKLSSLEAYCAEALRQRDLDRKEQCRRASESLAADALFEQSEAAALQRYADPEFVEPARFVPGLRVHHRRLELTIGPGRVTRLHFARADDAMACGAGIKKRGGFSNFSKWELLRRLCGYGVRWPGFECWLHQYQATYEQRRTVEPLLSARDICQSWYALMSSSHSVAFVGMRFTHVRSLGLMRHFRLCNVLRLPLLAQKLHLALLPCISLD